MRLRPAKPVEVAKGKWMEFQGMPVQHDNEGCTDEGCAYSTCECVCHDDDWDWDEPER